LLGFACTCIGQDRGKASTSLVISADKVSKLQLEVRQMPLEAVLKAIAEKTQVPIHFSVLPEGLVTATCVGSTLKPVLECLLDQKADLIVRYPRSLAKPGNNGQVAEAWVLGSRLDGTTAKSDCSASTPVDKGSITLRQDQQSAEIDRTEGLLTQAQSKNAEKRADAIGGLLAGGRKGVPQVKAALEQALHDPDAIVRSQAISSYAHREGSAATGAIQEALRDSSVDVRMMAIGGITDDVALLQQAVNDSDETIRALVALKLERLTQGHK
jgi:hypothetical protein